MQDLKKDQKDKIKTWINKADIKGANTENLSWIPQKASELEEYILKYNASATKSAHFNVLAQISKMLGREDVYKKYSKLSTDWSKKVQGEKKEQKLKPSREKKWVSWKKLMEIRDDLEEDFEKYPADNKVNLSYLTLCLYTYQPPIRSEYAKMKITTEKPKKDKINYLWEHKGKYTIVLNSYKTSRFYGRKEIPVESKTLTNIIKESLKNHPRAYLLSAIKKETKTKPLGYQNLYKYVLPDIFNKKSSEAPGIDDFRAFYISQYYDNRSMDEKDVKESHNHKEKEALADKMCHSAREAYETYYKLTGNNIPDEDKYYPNITGKKEKKEQKEEESDEESESDSDSETETDEEGEEKGKKSKLKFDRKAYMKKYREENKDKFKKYAQKYYKNNTTKVLRQKIIAELNSGNVAAPLLETITNYGLKYNKTTKLWY